MSEITFIDLFAGAGGMSEGFIRAGFTPVAHVEIDKASCNTILTRTAYHHLTNTGDFEKYIKYIKNEGITRDEIHSLLPEKKKNSVVNLAISDKNNSLIFKKIDELKGNNKKIDIIIGGPPCQAYSVVGRSRDENNMIGDHRNYLYKEYAKYLEYFQPEYFVFENVTGLLSAKTEKGASYLNKMLSLFEKKGYTTEYRILEAKDFGVLQNRRRVILIGKKGYEIGFYPQFNKWHPNVKVAEIFSDLPALKAGDGIFYKTEYTTHGGEYLFKSSIKNGLDFTTQHIARPHTEQDKEIYRIAVKRWNKYQERLNYNDLPDYLKTHNNRNSFLDRFKVVAEDLPYSQTVVAHASKDGHYYIHPDIQQNRSLTPRELARLQSFPDDYYFENISEKPGRTAAFKQIGNAVPPLMAEAIAKGMRKALL